MAKHLLTILFLAVLQPGATVYAHPRYGSDDFAPVLSRLYNS